MEIVHDCETRIKRKATTEIQTDDAKNEKEDADAATIFFVSDLRACFGGGEPRRTAPIGDNGEREIGDPA